MLRSYWSINISPNFPSFLSKHKKLIITNNMELELQPLNGTGTSTVEFTE